MAAPHGDDRSPEQPAPSHEGAEAPGATAPDGADAAGAGSADGTDSPDGTGTALFARPSARERRLLTDALRTETVGGTVLLVATVVALLCANTPLSHLYETVRSFHFGIPALGLDLSVEHWASDGILTVFFFVAGIELKRELTVGELRRPAAAALPVVAAVCGMAVPALCYVAVNLAGGGQMHGWAVPMATDIAFALGVLAVIGTNLPSGLRAFLLTLAIVDDLGAILVIAVFYTSTLNWAAFAGAVVGLIVFRILHVNLRVRGWYLYVPLGVVIWALAYNSGVHATIAGVAMGLMLRVRPDRPGSGAGDTGSSPAERVEHLVRPLSAGFAVPVFALFAAGVGVSGSALAETFRQPEALGVMLGLFAGKFLGVFGGTYLTARFTRARLGSDLAWADIAGVAMLAGIGFTVSLLVTELAFTDAGVTEHTKAAVLLGSLFAAAVACVLLKLRDAKYRRLWEEETRDEDADGVADIDQPVDHALRPTEAARRAAEAMRRPVRPGTPHGPVPDSGSDSGTGSEPGPGSSSEPGSGSSSEPGSGTGTGTGSDDPTRGSADGPSRGPSDGSPDGPPEGPGRT
ncbi:Na+/H+ antiporter NhaA [Streptomyces sp. NRRL F-5053]|uniref:Na+/H+ antiporter NhaA n=1 Tax=Streptomyces sp. NRRL F-5053 TaxID=1463854 RepID=UPI00099C3EC7|nr:Na+/H+ antiporter NhaA [Streptomyces sp. NRRL F-5053]